MTLVAIVSVEHDKGGAWHDRSARVTPFGYDGFGKIVPLTVPKRLTSRMEPPMSVQLPSLAT